MGFPSQSETNFSNPQERFLWAFRGIGFNGFPLSAPEAVFKEWSEHLSRAGFVHVSEVEEALCAEGVDPAGVLGRLPSQEIHYQPPVRGQDHPLNTSGQWIPVDQPIKEPSVPTASLMTPGEKAKMIQEFREEGLID